MITKDWTNSRTLLWAYYIAKKAYCPIAISLASFFTGVYVHIVLTNGIK